MTLHVRNSNVNAHHLYFSVFRFVPFDVEVGYYLDGENAICCKLLFDTSKRAEAVENAKNKGIWGPVEVLGITE